MGKIALGLLQGRWEEVRVDENGSFGVRGSGSEKIRQKDGWGWKCHLGFWGFLSRIRSEIGVK